MGRCNKFPMMAFACAIVASLLSGCGDKAVNTVEKQPAKKEEARLKNRTEESVSFEDYDLISFNLEKETLPIETLLASEYTIQNKSDSSSISNLAFEFETVDEMEKPIELLLENDPVEYLIELEPRESARLKLSASLDRSEAMYSTEEGSNEIIAYSYDMGGKRYHIDVEAKTACSEPIQDESNVDFDEVNVLSYEESAFSKKVTNNGANPIKSLEIVFALYDAEGHAIETTDSGVIALGEPELAAGATIPAPIDSLLMDDEGHAEPVYYKYETGIANDDGFNSFEVNLLTGQAMGSTNVLLLDGAGLVSAEEAKAELNNYMNEFGKTVKEMSFEVEKIDKEEVGTEWIHIKDHKSLFGIDGEVTLGRDYDTLRIDGLDFISENPSDSLRSQLLQTLKSVFGNEYEPEFDGDELVRATWETEDRRVILFLRSCSIRIWQLDNEE